MPTALPKALSALLSLLLCTALAWQDAALAAGGQASFFCCPCCNLDRANCATPACCAKPSESRVPVTPAPLPANSGNEFHALVSSTFPLLKLPSSDPNESAFAPFPVTAGALPIFQRDCSLLI